MGVYEQPSMNDWIELQGGEPRVEVAKRRLGLPILYNVIHDYEGGDGMIVPTHKRLFKSMGTTLYEIAGRVVEFQTVKVRALHGEPCEARSVRNGGGRYGRL